MSSSKFATLATEKHIPLSVVVLVSQLVKENNISDDLTIIGDAIVIGSAGGDDHVSVSKDTREATFTVIHYENNICKFKSVIDIPKFGYGRFYVFRSEHSENFATHAVSKEDAKKLISKYVNGKLDFINDCHTAILVNCSHKNVNFV